MPHLDHHPAGRRPAVAGHARSRSRPAARHARPIARPRANGPRDPLLDWMGRAYSLAAALDGTGEALTMESPRQDARATIEGDRVMFTFLPT